MINQRERDEIFSEEIRRLSRRYLRSYRVNEYNKNILDIHPAHQRIPIAQRVEIIRIQARQVGYIAEEIDEKSLLSTRIAAST